MLKTGAAPAALGAALLAGPAFAQEATPQADAAAPDQNVIVVTGSRIASPELAQSIPVQAVNAADIARTGAANVQDVLLRNPAVGTPSISRTNSSFANSSAGVATVDLRNLGIDRTLVLIDGRRVVAGIPGSAAVDLNTIPAPFIDRVEILTGGASAVYGSDAVAGVVNIITKKNFTGVEASGQYGLSTRGDDTDKQLNLTIGADFDEGRGNVMAYIGYTQQGAVFKRNRSTEGGPSDQDQTSLGGSITGDINDLFTPFNLYSGYTPGGRYFTDNNVFFYNNAGNLLPRYDAEGNQINTPPGFNRSAYRYLAVPVERYLAAFKGHYEISEAANVFMEGTFASTSAKTNIEPFPFDTSYVSESGQIPIESRYNGGIVRSPFVPDAIYNDASDTDGDGLRDIFVTKRLLDLGNRTSDAQRHTFRIVTGVDGKISDKWRYETYFIHGETSESQTGTGQINILNLRNALNAAVDTADVNGNGNTTEIICADSAARADGCVPANIFGPGSLRSAAAYLQAPTSLNTKTTQTVIGGNITGELFSLGWGADPIGVNLGVEYRREFSEATPDVLTQQGLNANNKIPPTSGKFNVKEAFAEAIVPIVADKPFFHSLSLKGAVRVSDYSTVGTVYSYNFGGEWAPVEDIRFRVTRAQTVRAPNINELFGPVSQDFPSNLNDPCAGITLTTTGALADRCRAAPGVLANINANGAFAVSQADKQGITSFAGGNSALGEEKGRSWTAGVVIQPRSINALRNMSLSIDYFDIDIKDAIVSTPLQFILNQCYVEGNQSFCNFIKRRPAQAGNNNAGSLDEVNGGLTNSGGARTSGIDFTWNWRQRVGSLGTLGTKVTYTRLLKGYIIPLVGSAKDEFAGEIGSAKNRFNAVLDFQNEWLNWSFNGTYIGASYVDDQLVSSLVDENGDAITNPRDPRAKVHAEFYLDTQIRFKVKQNYEFYIGMNNILDNKAPFLADIGASTGMATDAGTYDALGRKVYAGIKLRF
jgi:outer membrane receptor protein involved in Fe transport